MLHYALYRLQLAHTMAECILRHGGSDTLFPNDFGEDLSCWILRFCLLKLMACNSLVVPSRPEVAVEALIGSYILPVKCKHWHAASVI